MCGIVGVVMKNNSGFYKQSEDSFYQLLYADTVRGEDSTGVIAVEKDSTFHIAKEASEASWVIPRIRDGLIGKQMFSDGKAMIGHNRKKTVGKVSDETAHPFVVDDEFALVHNGTLYNHEKLAKTEVDSEALAITLAKAFEEEDYVGALEKTLPDVFGAYAVACYDQRHHKLRLLRNKDRPLAIIETTNAWYFASEGLMLQWILGRNGYSAKDLQTLRLIPEHTVLTFDLDSYTGSLKEETLNLKKSSPLLPAPATTVTGGTTTKSYTKSQTGKTLNTLLSKNEFKRLRRKHIGTKLEWWCEDYVEAHFPRTIEDGETVVKLMGQCSHFNVDNMVLATVDIKEQNLKESDLSESLWQGTVEDLQYDTLSQRLTVHIGSATMCPISVKPKLAVIDSKWIQEKMDEEEKSKSALH